MASSAIFMMIRALVTQIPIVIVLLLALSMLFRVAPSALRNTAITGVVILLLEFFFRLFVAVLPLLLSGRNSFEMQTMISGLYVMLSLLHALGLGLMAWALVKALSKDHKN